MSQLINRLICEMVEYYSGDPSRIQHFIKVHAFSKLIGEQEGIPSDTLFTLETAAVVHDIAIKLCEEKYGECAGPLQEKEGPALAREMLERLDFPADVTERVCYLVGHHHTYDDMDGIDYRILVEADFLVNLFEGDSSKGACANAYEGIFRTESGRELCRRMFMLD